MGRIVKFLIVIALLAVVAYAVKTNLLDKPGQTAETAKAPDEISAEPTLDLTEQQVIGSIKIEKLGTATFTPVATAVGNIDFNQNLAVQVFTPYQGRIINAFPNIGDQVKKGDVLFTIDSPDLLNAESTLIAAAGVLDLQNLTLKRALQMKAFGGAAQQAVDQSTSDQQTAEGALKTARDAVRIFGKTDAEIDAIVKSRKADPTLVVKSPIDGFITTRTAQPGLLVQPGATPPVFTVADVSTMWMFANVVETDAPLLKVGQKVKAHVAAFPGREFDGKIVVISPTVDPNSRRVFVRMEIADPDQVLRAQMLATFTIFVGEPIVAVAAPERAIFREGDGTLTTWTTMDKRRFTRKTVKVGLLQNDYYQVIEGLGEGELIISENGSFLSNKLAGAGPED